VPYNRTFWTEPGSMTLRHFWLSTTSYNDTDNVYITRSQFAADLNSIYVYDSDGNSLGTIAPSVRIGTQYDGAVPTEENVINPGDTNFYNTCTRTHLSCSDTQPGTTANNYWSARKARNGESAVGWIPNKVFRQAMYGTSALQIGMGCPGFNDDPICFLDLDETETFEDTIRILSLSGDYIANYNKSDMYEYTCLTTQRVGGATVGNCTGGTPIEGTATRDLVSDFYGFAVSTAISNDDYVYVYDHLGNLEHTFGPYGVGLNVFGLALSTDYVILGYGSTLEIYYRDSYNLYYKHTFVNGTGDGQLNVGGMTYISADDDFIYVVDNGNNKVLVIDYDGTPIVDFGAGTNPYNFTQPRFIKTTDTRIYVYDNSAWGGGKIITQWDKPTPSAYNFTPEVDGNYEIIGQAVIESVPSGSYGEISIYKNGIKEKHSRVYNNSASARDVTVQIRGLFIEGTASWLDDVYDVRLSHGTPGSTLWTKSGAKNTYIMACRTQ